MVTPRGANAHWPAASCVNSGRPANSANAICSATTRGAPGSWHTCSMSATASAGPLPNNSHARRVSTVSVRRVDTPSTGVMAGTRVAACESERSGPRVVALERQRHAARPATTAHELRALERDHRAFAVADALLPREEVDCGHDLESHLLQLAQCRLVARIRDRDARSRRHEVAAARPLFALLHGAMLAAAEHRLHGQTDVLECRENVRHFAHVSLTLAAMENRQSLGAHEVRRMDRGQLA